MKKKAFLFFLILVCGTNLFGQSALTYTQMADSIFSPTNKSLITSGILYDRVAPFAGLHYFKNTDTSSYPHFVQAFSEIRGASYSNGAMMKVTRIDTASKALYYSSNTVPIGVLYFDFHWIDTLAINKNLFYKGADSLIHDVVGRTGNPYLLRNITVAAALPYDTLPYGNGTVQFRYLSQLFATNKAVTITTILADFGSGNQNLTSGSTVTATYGSGGRKSIKFTITYSNGQTAIAYSKFFLKAPAPSNRYGTSKEPEEYYDIDDTYGYQGVGETAKDYNRGRYGIYYHYTSATSNVVERVLRKPLIIVDGFDPQDKRDVATLYGVYLQYSPTAADNFGENMRKLGYDVIVLDLPKKKTGEIVTPYGIFEKYRIQGSDFIQRNAFVLVKLIEHINSRLIQNGSAEKLVVLGPSMGGLISRYALRWMENNGKNHNTRLWVSFDSPQKGANIPIGDQYFVDFYASKAGNEKAKDGRDNSLNTPAAKQMLLHHHLADSPTPSGAPNFRDAWQTEIDNLGYPQNLRRIALVNGAINGTAQSTACQNVYRMNAKLAPGNIFLMFAGFIQVAEGNIWFTGSYGSNCQVFKGWAKIPMINNTRSAAAPVSSKSYDIVPGGYFDTQRQLGEKTSVAHDNVPILFELTTIFVSTFTVTNPQVLNPIHSFIPTFSALGMSLTGKDLGENLYNRDLVCTGETPFHAYYAPIANEDHTTLTPENVTWVTEEIKGNRQMSSVNYDAVYPMSKTAGTDPVCATATFQINNLPAGSTVVWSASSNPSIAVVAGSGNIVTVTRQGNNSGTITFSAVVTRPCTGDPITLKKTLVVGSPSFPYSVTGASPANPNGIYTYSLQTTPANKLISNIVWTVPNGWSITLGQGTRNLKVQTGTSSGNVQVSFKDGCNTSFGTFKFVTIGPGGPDPEFTDPGNASLQVSPNPANTVLNVTLNANILSRTIKMENVTEVAGIHEIKLKDQMGVIRQHVKYSSVQRTASLNVQGLQPGIYSISVFDGKKWMNKQVIIVR